MWLVAWSETEVARGTPGMERQEPEGDASTQHAEEELIYVAKQRREWFCLCPPKRISTSSLQYAIMNLFVELVSKLSCDNLKWGWLQ